jgi:AraC-like DNA-binding protein
MVLRYEEWLPALKLRDFITAYWRVEGGACQVPSAAILPDAHVELVFNFGDPVVLVGPAYTGDQPERAVVGLLSHAIRLEYRGPVNTFGIRFRPACGASFLGQPAVLLVDRLFPMHEMSKPLDVAFSRLFAGNWRPDHESCRSELDQILLRQLPLSPALDSTILSIVNRLTIADPVPTVAQMAGECGLSSRQLQRRFLATVGMAPKQFVRVVRFARLWQAASMSPPDKWADVAAEHGYADQAHMVREFRAFGVDPPTHFFTSEWYDRTSLSRVSGPFEDL